MKTIVDACKKLPGSGLTICLVILGVGALLTVPADRSFAQETAYPPDDAPFAEVDSPPPLEQPSVPDLPPVTPPSTSPATPLPAITGTWISQGPGPSRYGQVENVFPDDEVSGAVHTLAAHPTDPDILYLGGVNGGVWKTTNGTATSPTWTPLTDTQASLSIGALEFDPADATHNTLWAGIGRFSSYSSRGGLRTGLLQTIDGGRTWSALDGGGVLVDKNISGIAPRGSIVVVSVNYAEPFTFGNIGIFRSLNGGSSFSQISSGSGAGTGLPGGLSYDLASHRNAPTVLYTSIVYASLVGGLNGIYKSTDTGATWTKVSSTAMDALLIDSVTSNVEISVGMSGTVHVAILNYGQLRNGGVFQSPNGNAGTWVPMDIPLVNEAGGSVGTNPRYKADAGVPGGQGAIHFSILADETTPTVLYVGGDRQPAGYNDCCGFPNALGAVDYSGRLFRGDASVAATGGVPSPQWKHLTHTIDAGSMIGGGTLSNSSPHADSREMVFDANDDIIEGDDGGIYRRTSPQSNTGDWFSINGNLQVTEQHDIAYDPISDIIISGNQDTGTTQQSANGSSTWDSVSTADGGDVAVAVDPANPLQSVRYSSYQYLGAFRRRIYDANGALVSQSFPSLLVTSGSTLGTQFVTPVEVNQTDATRLLIGGDNGLYESLDQGTTIAQVSATGVNSADGGNMMVYGGKSENVDNPDLIYAAVGGAKVAIRTSAAGGFSEVVPLTAGTIRGVIADPEEWRSVFAIDADQVFYSDDAGATWSDITGDLPTAFTTVVLRAIAYVRHGDDGALIVGTNQGIYAAMETDYTTWYQVGDGLPNAPVWDLIYDATDDVLVAGTLGRGSWSLADASQHLFPTTPSVIVGPILLLLLDS